MPLLTETLEIKALFAFGSKHEPFSINTWVRALDDLPVQSPEN
jgi:hypothetical protein